MKGGENMKKIYTKPEIIFEDFSLSTNIAGDCELDTSLQSPDECGYQLRTGEIVFLSKETGCDTVPVDGAYNGYCYHVPTEDNNLFNS